MEDRLARRWKHRKACNNPGERRLWLGFSTGLRLRAGVGFEDCPGLKSGLFGAGIRGLSGEHIKSHAWPGLVRGPD